MLGFRVPMLPPTADSATHVVAPHWRLVTPARWPWRHFSPEELASPRTGEVRTAVDAGDRLDALRTEIGWPLSLNSAYRDPIHNALIGGAPRSRHKTGHAFDVRVAVLRDPGLARAVFEAAVGLGFRGIGRYRTFVHLDVRRRAARWWGAGGETAWSS